MGYLQALKAAGATILEFKEFGSYQGEWWALVRVNDKIGWIGGSYGSCSGCDAFEAEFGYSDSHEHEGNKYISCYGLDEVYDENCSTCIALKKRLANFGQNYIDDMVDQDKALEMVSRNLEWDMDAPDMVDFIKAHDYTKE